MNVQTFLTAITDQIKPLSLANNLAFWELNTFNSKAAESRYYHTKKELLQLYANPELFQEIKRLSQESINDPLERRQITLLYRAFLINQIPADLLTAIVDLEKNIEGIFVDFRAPFGDNTAGDCDLKELLSHTKSSHEARRIWETSKLIGPEVAPSLIKLVKLRNKAARLLGFRNFFELSLFGNELNAYEVMHLLTQLTALTDEPFDRIKSKLDKVLAAKFNLDLNCLKPWHYGDPFFQETPAKQGPNLEPYFQVNLIQTATHFYQEIGFEAAAILKKSDLFGHPGKSQHSFSIDINQQGDVRILCNLRPNNYWLKTLLHELGHSFYAQNINAGLPYLLKNPAHILTTEAIAILMGRLTSNPDWLHKYLSIPQTELKKLQPCLKYENIQAELIFIRWGLVMVNFESQLYQDPAQDLNTLWWDLVEKFQKLTRPDNRNQADWAAVTHLGIAPVYYQNYLLGECAASQIGGFIQKNVSRTGKLLADEKIGDYLRKNIFQPGSSFHWNQLIKQATGKILTPAAFQSEVAPVIFD